MTTDQAIRAIPGDQKSRALQAERQGGQAMFPVDMGQYIALWDVLEGAWTKPIPRTNASGYLERAILKCSLCPFAALDEMVMLPNGQWINTTSAKVRLGQHLGQVMERGKRHADATIIQSIVGDRSVPMCTGCDTAFAANPWRAREHLAEVQAEGVAHVGQLVEGLLFHKFTLRPSEPVVLERILIAPGSKVNPIERSSVQRDATRKRRRNRSRH